MSTKKPLVLEEQEIPRMKSSDIMTLVSEEITKVFISAS